MCRLSVVTIAVWDVRLSCQIVEWKPHGVSIVGKDNAGGRMTADAIYLSTWSRLVITAFEQLSTRWNVIYPFMKSVAAGASSPLCGGMTGIGTWHCGEGAAGNMTVFAKRQGHVCYQLALRNQLFPRKKYEIFSEVFVSNTNGRLTIRWVYLIRTFATVSSYQHRDIIGFVARKDR